MERLLIVNADDLGYDPGIDRGILEAAANGIVRSTTAMVNLPGAEIALSKASAIPQLGIGLHLNFARGPSLAGAPSLIGDDGELDERRAPTAPLSEIAAEIEAQLRRFNALTGRMPTHLDVHKHLHRHESILEAVIRMAVAHALPMRALDGEMRARVLAAGARTTAHFIGDTGEEAYWTAERVLEALDALGEGSTELMCHPGYRPEEVRTSYGLQRETELAAFIDPRVLERTRRGDIQLVSFTALRELPEIPTRAHRI